MLIALYERAVGLYAYLININAYHQPGVEAGKRGASAVLSLQIKAFQHLSERRGTAFTAVELAAAIGAPDESEAIFKIMEHLSANQGRGIIKTSGVTPFDAKYSTN